MSIISLATWRFSSTSSTRSYCAAISLIRFLASSRLERLISYALFKGCSRSRCRSLSCLCARSSKRRSRAFDSSSSIFCFLSWCSLLFCAWVLMVAMTASCASLCHFFSAISSSVSVWCCSRCSASSGGFNISLFLSVESGSMSSIFAPLERISSPVEASISTIFDDSPSFIEAFPSTSPVFICFPTETSSTLFFSSSSDFAPTEIFPMFLTSGFGSSVVPE